MKFGAHMSTGGGVWKALERGASINCEIVKNATPSYYSDNVKLLLLVVLMLVASRGFGLNYSLYELDLNGPRKLVSLPRGIALPTRVEIHRKGPEVWFDKTDRWLLSYQASDFSVTNAADIEKLVKALGEACNQDDMARIAKPGERLITDSKLKGYTYHFLLLNDVNKTMMHFRVFETTEFPTIWRSVYPKSDTSSFYFNNTIGPWMDTQFKLTNKVPTESVTNQNILPSKK